jgi:hypothetical protein
MALDSQPGFPLDWPNSFGPPGRSRLDRLLETNSGPRAAATLAVTAFGVVSSAIVFRALQECASTMIDPNMASAPAAETRAVRK